MNTDYIKPPSEVEVLKPYDLTISNKNVNYEIQSFTKEEIKLLLERVPPGKHSMMFQFLWRTGIRVSECNSVEKQHLNFEHEEITIRWLKKRKALHRIIPMHNSLKGALFLYTANMRYDEKIFYISRQRIDQLCKKYGFDHAHKIRHSFAIHFLRESKDPMALYILQLLLGHEDIKSTMNYLKIVPVSMKLAMQRISFD
jgi:integrase